MAGRSPPDLPSAGFVNYGAQSPVSAWHGSCVAAARVDGSGDATIEGDPVSTRSRATRGRRDP